MFLNQQIKISKKHPGQFEINTYYLLCPVPHISIVPI